MSSEKKRLAQTHLKPLPLFIYPKIEHRKIQKQAYYVRYQFTWAHANIHHKVKLGTMVTYIGANNYANSRDRHDRDIFHG